MVLICFKGIINSYHVVILMVIIMIITIMFIAILIVILCFYKSRWVVLEDFFQLSSGCFVVLMKYEAPAGGFAKRKNQLAQLHVVSTKDLPQRQKNGYGKTPCNPQEKNAEHQFDSEEV